MQCAKHHLLVALWRVSEKRLNVKKQKFKTGVTACTRVQSFSHRVGRNGRPSLSGSALELGANASQKC